MLNVACQAFIDLEDVTCDCDEDNEERVQDLIDSASDILTILSDGQVSGICTDVVIPRGSDGCFCTCWNYPGPWPVGASARGCVCERVHGITLRGPNPQVSEVLLMGLPFTAFAILDGKLLIRTDGKRWPSCQDVTNPSMIVTYTYGIMPQLAKDAAAEIVCWSLANDPQSKGKLPTGTRGVNIAGVQITLESVLAEQRRRTFLLPHTTRFLTVYGSAGATAYSPELEDGWKLHRITQPVAP